MRGILTLMIVLFNLPSEAQWTRNAHALGSETVDYIIDGTDNIQLVAQKLLPVNKPSILGPRKDAYDTASDGTIYVIEGEALIDGSATAPQVLPLNHDTCILTRADIAHMPYTNINDMLSIYPGVYQKQRGGDVRIFGSR